MGWLIARFLQNITRYSETADGVTWGPGASLHAAIVRTIGRRIDCTEQGWTRSEQQTAGSLGPVGEGGNRWRNFFAELETGRKRTTHAVYSRGVTLLAKALITDD